MGLITCTILTVSENSGTEMAGNTNTPPSQGVPSKDEMPPEPPNGFDSTTGNRPDNLGMPPGGTSSVPTSYSAITTYTEAISVPLFSEACGYIVLIPVTVIKLTKIAQLEITVHTIFLFFLRNAAGRYF